MRHYFLLLALGCALVVSSVHSAKFELEDDTDDQETEQDEVTDYSNPCTKHTCGRGEECDIDENDKAFCVCRRLCPETNDDRAQVCSRQNRTYATACHLDQQHCLCRSSHADCHLPDLTKIQLDYFGACQELTSCPEGELLEFPTRTRNWLLNVMKELANRKNLGEYVGLLDAAKEDPKHTNAVLWKFCDLDKRPHDRFVTRRELLFIIRALKHLERCLVPFLDGCDVNDDKKISMKEWGHCLQLEDDKITDLCADIRSRV